MVKIREDTVIELWHEYDLNKYSEEYCKIIQIEHVYTYTYMVEVYRPVTINDK